MEANEVNVSEEFLKFKGKKVIVGLRTNDEYEGKLISIDDYLNSVIETENGEILTLKGGEVNFVALNED